VAFFATLPLYSPNMVFSPAMPGFVEVMPFFANATLLAALVYGAFVAVLALVRPRLADALPLRPVGICLSSLLYVLGFSLLMCAFVFVEPSGGLSVDTSASSSAGLPVGLPVGPTLGLAAGVICGITVINISLAWGSVFSAFGIREALFNLAILCAICALINYLFTLIVPQLLVPAFLLLVALGVAYPSYRAISYRAISSRDISCQAACDARDAAAASRDNGEQRDDLDTEGNSAFETTNTSELHNAAKNDGRTSAKGHPIVPAEARLLGTFKRLLQVLHAPLMGFLLFALTMAMRKVMIGGGLYAEGLGAILAVALLLPLCFRRSEKPLLPFIYQVFLPIFAVILIVLNSFPVNSPIQYMGQLGLYAFFAVIGLQALASLSAAAQAREFPVSFIFGLALSAFAGVSFLGLRLSEVALISAHSDEVLLVLSTLYFVYLTLAPGLKAWRSLYLPTEAPATQHIREDLEQRCTTLAATFGLSPRESEIVSYMGRGYAPAFIAKKLFLSDSTVRSHVRNIYRKMQVNSREDLLQLIEDGLKRR
jgi:DNA-binding CsgD family transcriptional regulator